MGKFLFFDIDGTLVGKSREVTQKNKEAIALARENGHKAFVCTGRAPTSIDKDILKIGFDGIISSAGGFVIIDDEFIFENFINQYVLSEVMTIFINNRIFFSLETKNTIYETAGTTDFFHRRHVSMYKDNPELIRAFELRRKGESRKNIKDFNICTTGVTKVCFIAEDKQNFYRVKPFLEEFFNIVLFSKDEDSYCNGEIIIKNCTKVDGIIKVVDHFGGKMKDTIAFGDSMNDYEMIQEASVGVVYEGAVEELKQHASHFFKEPDEDGIYISMKELGLI